MQAHRRTPAPPRKVRGTGSGPQIPLRGTGELWQAATPPLASRRVWFRQAQPKCQKWRDNEKELASATHVAYQPMAAGSSLG
jgi:hypothetical protein